MSFSLEDAFHAVPTAEVHQALAQAAGALPEEGAALYEGTTDLIFLLSKRSQLSLCNEVLEKLIQCHPGQYFILCMDDSLSELQSEIAVFCTQASEDHAVCVKLGRFFSPHSELSRVPSVLRSLLGTGSRTEVFVFDPDVETSVVELLAPLGAVIVYDSAILEATPGLVGHLNGFGKEVVDLRWAAISEWRGEIARIFEVPEFSAHLPELRSLEVSACHLPTREIPAVALLFAGWVLDRLSYTLDSCGSQGFFCSSPGKPQLLLRFPNDPSGSTFSLNEITFKFGGNEQGAAEGRIVLRAGAVLESLVEFQQSYHFSRQIEHCALPELIERYYAVGESTAQYRSALRFALELDSLLKGYLGT